MARTLYYLWEMIASSCLHSVIHKIENHVHCLHVVICLGPKELNEVMKLEKARAESVISNLLSAVGSI